MPAKPRAALQLPTGTVTFLFSDIEGSTRLWETQYAAMQQVMPMIAMMAQAQGVTIPPDLLPPLELLKQHLSPAGAVAWVPTAERPCTRSRLHYTPARLPATAPFTKLPPPPPLRA